MQFYSDPRREGDPHALPDCEVFYVDGSGELLDEDGEQFENGWYWWSCFPGCVPDSEAFGPFDSKKEAIADAQEPFEWD